MPDDRTPLELLRGVRDLARVAGLQAIDKAVLMTLILRSNRDGCSWPSYVRIAEDTWASSRTAKSSIKRLAAAGLITIEARRRDDSHERDSNRYTVSLPVVVVQSDHHVVKALHHVVQHDHDGGDQVAPHVVKPLHQCGDQVAQEVAHRTAHLELPKEGFALRAPEQDSESAKTKQAKHAPEQIAAKQKIVDCWIECFEATKGVRPKKIDAADHATAFALAKTYGEAEACSIVRRAFQDSFVVEKNSSLKFIASKSETWRGIARARSGDTVQPTPTAGGRAWTPGKPQKLPALGGGR